jgi:hypothetical protein
MYIPINNPQGGAEDISSFQGKKPAVSRKLSSNIGRVENKDLTSDLQFWTNGQMIGIP